VADVDDHYHAHGFAINVYFKAIAVVDLEGGTVDLSAALAHGKDAIGHLELDDLAFFEAFVSHHRVDVIVVVILDESRKKQQKQKT
jgi:hypothetical protein